MWRISQTISDTSLAEIKVKGEVEGSQGCAGPRLEIEKGLIGDLRVISSQFRLRSLRVMCSMELESRCFK